MNRICIGEKKREPFSWTTLRGKHCRHPIAIMGVVDTFGPWTRHTKKQILAILFLLMFQNKSHDKYDASEKISVNCVLEKYILQKWHTRRQRHGVLFFQPQCCLYVILKLLRILKWSNLFYWHWSYSQKINNSTNLSTLSTTGPKIGPKLKKIWKSFRKPDFLTPLGS